jgi:NADPH-dependent glutamate synthase beta subunit-like oxidoreductase
MLKEKEKKQNEVPQCPIQNKTPSPAGLLRCGVKIKNVTLTVDLHPQSVRA